MKKTILAAALVAASTTAFADTSIYGHINYVAGDVEDFSGEEGFEIQNGSTSTSRAGIRFSKDAGGITYGIRQEWSISATNSLTTRHSDLYAKGAFGKVSLGQGSEAGDDAVENDFSGTYVLTGSEYESWSLSQISDNIDESRDERLRYDTPNLGGFYAAASINDTDDINVEAGFRNQTVKASIYGSNFDDTDAAPNRSDQDAIGGSIAFQVAGFNAALQGGERSDADYEFGRVIVGYKVGGHRVAVDYTTEDTNGSEVETTGLSYVFLPTKGVELYAGYREAEADAAIFNGEEDGDAILIGSRVKF